MLSASLIVGTSDANDYSFLFKHVPSLYPALGVDPSRGFNQSGLHNPDSTEKLVGGWERPRTSKGVHSSV